MRWILISATALGLGACTMPGGNYDVAPKVTYGYGLGDNATPDGPKPNYSFAYGLGDNATAPGPKPNYSTGYGADGLTTDRIAMSPATQTRVASPSQGTSSPTHL